MFAMKESWLTVNQTDTEKGREAERQPVSQETRQPERQGSHWSANF